MHLTSSGPGSMGIPPAPDLYGPRDHILFLDLDFSKNRTRTRTCLRNRVHIRHVRVHVLGNMYMSDMYGYLLYMYDVSKST